MLTISTNEYVDKAFQIVFDMRLTYWWVGGRHEPGAVKDLFVMSRASRSIDFICLAVLPTTCPRIWLDWRIYLMFRTTRNECLGLHEANVEDYTKRMFRTTRNECWGLHDHDKNVEDYTKRMLRTTRNECLGLHETNVEDYTKRMLRTTRNECLGLHKVNVEDSTTRMRRRRVTAIW